MTGVFVYVSPTSSSRSLSPLTRSLHKVGWGSAAPYAGTQTRLTHRKWIKGLQIVSGTSIETQQQLKPEREEQNEMNIQEKEGGQRRLFVQNVVDAIRAAAVLQTHLCWSNEALSRELTYNISIKLHDLDLFLPLMMLLLVCILDMRHLQEESLLC